MFVQYRPVAKSPSSCDKWTEASPSQQCILYWQRETGRKSGKKEGKSAKKRKCALLLGRDPLLPPECLRLRENACGTNMKVPTCTRHPRRSGLQAPDLPEARQSFQSLNSKRTSHGEKKSKLVKQAEVVALSVPNRDSPDHSDVERSNAR